MGQYTAFLWILSIALYILDSQAHFVPRLMPKFVLIVSVCYSLYNIEQNRHGKYA